MNPENDLRSAIGANYDLQSLKGASASGSLCEKREEEECGTVGTGCGVHASSPL